jgi:hypothetical protein
MGLYKGPWIHSLCMTADTISHTGMHILHCIVLGLRRCGQAAVWPAWDLLWIRPLRMAADTGSHTGRGTGSLASIDPKTNGMFVQTV